MPWLCNALHVLPLPFSDAHPAKVMVWGGISWFGTLPLMVYDENGTQDADQYLEMLKNDVIPECHEYFENGRFTWQQVWSTLLAPFVLITRVMQFLSSVLNSPLDSLSPSTPARRTVPRHTAPKK
jgi:hypothetical protein